MAVLLAARPTVGMKSKAAAVARRSRRVLTINQP
jgi:hypothetical protein